MSQTASDLELLALARLGLAKSAALDEAKPGEGVVDALVRLGRLGSADVSRVKAYISRNTIACSCGERLLPLDDDLAFACPACGKAYFRRSAGVWQPAKATPPPGVGSRIGPLELESVLGKGAQGTVFLARHVQLGRLSAVKILPAAAVDDHKRRRFAREVEALARLTHPSIVRVHATFEFEGCLACEMELVKGETLEERLDRTGPLPWRDAVALVAKIARAVAHAHSAGVLHRDLKPANVLLRARGGTGGAEPPRSGTDIGEPLLADFGLSRLTDLASSLTVAGAQLGTPFYMAPEAFGGDSSEATDVYGLGAILYQCLTALPPFNDTTLAALYHKISKGLCEPTRAHGAPASVDAVRAIAMAPDPTRRYESAEAFALDLERVLAGRGPSGSAVSRLESRGSRRRASLAAAASALLVVAVTAAVVVVRARRAPLDGEVETVAAAIAVLEREAAPADPAATARAAQTLAAAIRGSSGSQRELLRDLDAAVARAPGSLELRRARALLARARSLPVATADLAAVGSLAADAAPDLEAIATHAASAGLQGDDPVGVARSVWLAHRDSKGAALLYAFAAAGKGDPALRAQVVEALRGARSSQARAQRLERALADVDRLAELLRGSEKLRESPETATLARRLTDSVRELAREPSLSRAGALVLSPLEPASREYLRHVQVADALESESRRRLIDLLDALDDQVTPYLFVVREVFRIANNASVSEPDIHAPIDRLDAAARELADPEPLLAALAYQGVAAMLADAREKAHSPADVQRVGEAADRVRACAAEFSRRTRSPTDTEVKFRDQSLRRASMSEAIVHELLIDLAPDPATKRAERELAAEARRRVCAISGDGGLLFGNVKAKDARRVIDHLLVLGELTPPEPAIELVAQRDGLRLEALRRRDPGAAFARAKAAAVRTPEVEAVCARAAADLRLDGEALESVRRLYGLEYSLFDFFTPPRVQQYVEAKLR